MITFKQFIEKYNFRYINDIQNDRYNFDTTIIRIYPDKEGAGRDYWFEFGVYDFSETKYKMDICEKVLTKEIMDSYVQTISCNPELEKVVTIYLTKSK